MRGDHKSDRLVLLERGDRLEGIDLLGSTGKVDQQYVLPLDISFYSWNQHQSMSTGVGAQRFEVELPVVQGNGKCVVVESRSSVDQLMGRMRDVIFGVVRGVGV